MLSVLGFLLGIVAYFVLTYVVVDIAKTTHKHYSTGNEFHPEPFPIHFALLVALIEVCWDKPVAFHRARMQAVRDAEGRRADAIEAAMLRHPANFKARQASMNAHPTAFRARQSTMRNHPAMSADRVPVLTGGAS